jgi:hypothetical protein
MYGMLKFWRGDGYILYIFAQRRICRNLRVLPTASAMPFGGVATSWWEHKLIGGAGSSCSGINFFGVVVEYSGKNGR